MIHPYLYAGLKTEWQLRSTKPKILTQEFVINIVCEYFNLHFYQLQTNSRLRELVYPRQILMYMLYEHTSNGYKNIGRLFHRDHSTVIYATRVIEDLISVNKDIKVDVNNIKALLK